MADQDFDQVAKILFRGVPSLPKMNSIGTLVPFTEDTRAVLGGDDMKNIIIAAARYGDGRCLVFGERNYPKVFVKKIAGFEQFVENCRQWLTRGQGGEFFSIDTAKTLRNIPLEGKILVWDGQNVKPREVLDDLYAHMRNGGALVCGSSAPIWIMSNKGKGLDEFCFACFCEPLGIRVARRTSKSSNPIVFRPGAVEFRNVQRVITELERDPTNTDYLQIVENAIREFGNELPCTDAAALHNIVKNASSDMFPKKSCPIRDPNTKGKMTGVCGIMCAIPGLKAPGIHEFPGDFEQTPPLAANVVIDVKNSQDPWHSTGYYAVAGVPVQIEVLEKTGPDGWSIRIGCHSDNLTNCSEYRRWPCISLTKSLNARKSIEMHSPYGGLIFLEPPSGRSGSIRVQLNNVALTPSYELDDPNRAEHWQHACSNAAGLWANIAGRHICFNLPSKSVLHMNDEQLDRVLAFWDSVILAHNDLRGTKPERRERVVCDEQPSAGSMHSGYPVVTQMNISVPNSDRFVFNYEKLKQSGSWGLFHELGHNMQRGWWTFSGTGEVTVNLFTLYTMEKVCKIPTWLHPSLKSQMSGVQRFIRNNLDFEEWKKQHTAALIVYVQLVHEFGWNTFKQVLRQYEREKPTVTNDQEKIDLWVTKFSKLVGKNLIPLFKFWNIPISDSAVSELESLEIPNINDQFIELAPERYKL